ncbi:MAG: superoxide dismutase family protein [Candidatus Margulisiibacteriota bacterium]
MQRFILKTLLLFSFTFITFAQDSSSFDSSRLKAVAVIFPTEGHRVSGTFLFQQLPDGVKVSAILSGLVPNQKHGVHVHQWGDLTDMKKGLLAGSHYNPDKHPHGLPPNPIRHAGAFGNIQANDQGEAMFEFIDDTITINGIKNPVLGRAVVVHAKEDTGEQPAGNAGPRIGLGVIGLKKYQ